MADKKKKGTLGSAIRKGRDAQRSMTGAGPKRTRSQRLNERAETLRSKGKTAKANLLEMRAKYGPGGERAMLQAQAREQAMKFAEDPTQFGLTQQQMQDQIAAATQGQAAAAQQQQAALAQQALAAPGGFQAGYLADTAQQLGQGATQAAMDAAGQAQQTSQQMIAQKGAQVKAELERALQRKRDARNQTFSDIQQSMATTAQAAQLATGIAGNIATGAEGLRTGAIGYGPS